MSTPITHASRRRGAKPGRLHARVNSFLGAFLATMVALPASAGIALPNDPLTTGSRVPPNIMFILDNSGSMALVSMPTLSTDTNFDVQPVGYTGTATGADRTGLRDDPHDRSYLNNGVYYNPTTNYQAWMNADGVTRMTGGTTESAAYSNWNLASGTTIDLRGNAESIFYVPHAGVVASTTPNVADYDRYSINSSGDVVKSIVGGRPTASIGLPAGTYASTSAAVVVTINITVPSGSDARNFRVFTTGGNNRVQLDLYAPLGVIPQCTANSGTAGESCLVASPVPGVWRATLKRDGTGSGANFTGVTIDATVDTQIAALPPLPSPMPARTQAQELINIATWYSYYRTRLKTAKAGASEAFAGLSRDLRIGYTPINGRSSHLSATGTNAIIPVNNNNGLFEGANKTAWFSSVQTAVVQDGSTPLRTALKAVGDYYTRSDTNGPWGPGLPANHLACRQSFSILTTDGYWNDSAPSGIGDSDGDGHSPTLADVADYYYKTDLRTLNNIVPSTTEDPANWQHMSTFGISIGLRGTMTITEPPPASNAAIWTDPTTATEDARRIDDLWHASVNGHGRFVAASDPKSFSQGLQAALAKIGERTGSFSNVSANSTTLEAGTYIFQAKYTSAVWTGELLGHNITVPNSIPWKASEGISATGRRVYTSNDGTAGAPLAFPGSATTAQLAALARPAPAVYPATGAQNAAYLAGDRSREINNGGVLRNRNHLLGDIVTSSPVYVKDTNTVYVGANDGMLHAFNAANGQEVFAYIPNAINWQDLSTLSRPDYGHRYFVDGPIVVSNRTETPSRNVLAGVLGRGGKGIYALDVTNPTLFGSANNVLWEKKADDLLATTADNNIGNVLGKPIIAKLNNNSMALIVSNGVNSTGEKAVLLVYDLVSGALLKEIDTGVGSAAAPNGLFEAVGWNADGNGTLDYVYAGDMQGNVWKFDLSSTSPATWGVANGGSALFAATAAQPVTGGLTVAMHPTTFKTWVFFGTGRFMTTSDQTNTATQSLYGIEDTNSTVPKASITQRRVVYGETRDGKRQRAAQPNQALPTNSRGWYIDLLEPPLPGTQIGERIVSSPQVVGRNLQVNSIIPTNDACGSDGKGYANVFDAFTGTSVSSPYWDVNGNRNFTDDVLTYTDASGNVVTVPVASVDPNVGMLTQGALMGGSGNGGQMCVGGSSGSMVCIGTNESRNVGRVSWREVIRN